MKRLAFRAGEKPRWEQLYRELREQLRRGKFAPGARFHSDRALMRSRRLSLITVRTALDRLVADGLVVRRRGSGTYVTRLMPTMLGLRVEPSPARPHAPRKVAPKRLRLGLIPHVRGWSPAFVPIYREVCERAAQDGHQVHILPQWDRQQPFEAYREALDLSFVDALIWAVPPVECLGLLREIRQSGLPLVLIKGHFVEEPFHEIATDTMQGVYLATDHLLRAGHERVALVIGPSASRTVERGERGDELTFSECKQGYVRALLSARIAPNDALVLEQEYGRERGRALAFLERRQPTAVVFTASSFLLKFLGGEGLKRWPVPGKLSVISVDNKHWTLTARWPETKNWTWLHEPFDVLGRMAAETALRLCRQNEPPSRMLVPMTLLEGNSVAKA